MYSIDRCRVEIFGRSFYHPTAERSEGRGGRLALRLLTACASLLFTPHTKKKQQMFHARGPI
jgi:hypothetical protein